MKILSGKKNVDKVIFLLTLDWAHDDDSDHEVLIFSHKEDAIAEFNSQLNKIKTSESFWECAALKTAADEHDYNEEDEPEYLTGKYDYLNGLTYRLNELISHPDRTILLKSFIIYQNGYEKQEHTYLSLRAVCVIGD